eukprot:TRINITY_DN4624_c0_g1_i2.p1 TRINITY_DN4624_c0_g1~~TRINITY_DN4624_c0_g1_i2.p1  ORF type:complete len:299 (-),score=46.46 TRINITY_DN4624_c0_g1_i2:193-1089(-)
MEEIVRVEKVVEDGGGTAAPPGRQGFVGVLNQGCHVIIWTGGRTSSNNAGRRSYLNDSWSYHLLDGKWQPLECKGSYPRRHNHSGVLYQGKLYIFGGQVDGEAYSNQIYTLDCSTYLWQELTPLGPCPSARHGHSCLLYGDYMLLFGGRDGRNNPHFGNDLWIFNLQNNSWKELKVSGNAPCGRYFHGMALLGDLLFVFGGFYWDGRERYLNDLHSVDLSPLQPSFFFHSSPAPRPGALPPGTAQCLSRGGRTHCCSMGETTLMAPKTTSWGTCGCTAWRGRHGERSTARASPPADTT